MNAVEQALNLIARGRELDDVVVSLAGYAAILEVIARARRQTS